MAAGPAYAAFISYSRAVDGRLAPRLKRALEGFGKPWYRLRAIRVFRDDSSLSANPGLWGSLTGALDRSDYFVLLASPGSAASEWVNREVEYWLGHRDRARLLLVLTEGDIAWDERAGDFDWERATAVPRALSGAYREEPRYTDLRFAATADHLSLRDPRFRDAVADVAAPLNGRAKDDMIGEEVRQHRRTLRLARGAGVLLAALTAAASVAAVLAIRAADRADRERDRAEQQARVASSRQLAAQSAVALRDGRLDAALAQAVGAWRTERTSQARDALLAGLKAVPGLVAIAPTRPADAARFSADGRRAALVDSDAGTVSVHDLLAGEVVVAPARYDGVDLALDPSGARMAIGGERGRMVVWDLAGGHRRVVARAGPRPTGPQAEYGPPAAALHPSFAPDGRRLAWSGPRAAVSVWDGRRTTRLRAPRDAGAGGWTVAVGARHLAAAGALSGEIVIWRLDRPRARARVVPGRPSLRAGVGGISSHGAIAIGGGRRPLLAVGGADDGRVDIRHPATGRRLRVLRTGRGEIAALAFSRSGRRLAVVDAAGVTVWDAAEGRRIARFPPAGAELGAAVHDDGRLLTLASDGTLTVRDIDRRSQLARRLVGLDDLAAPAFDPSGERVVGLDGRRRTRSWDTDGGRPGEQLTPPVDAGGFVFLGDGRLVTCCADLFSEREPARVWSEDGGSRAVAPELGVSVDAAVAHGDRLVVAGLRGNRIRLSDGDRTHTFERETFAADISPDGRFAVVSGEPGTELWGVDGLRRVAALKADATAFSPTGERLGVLRGGAITVHDPRTARRLASVRVGEGVDAFAISPDGRRLATVVTRSGTADVSRTVVELWDADTARKVGDEPLLVGADSLFPTADFSPDGRRLLVTGFLESGTLVLDIDPESWARRACALAPSCRSTPGGDAPEARG
jgi:WD40 repeat protein